MYLKIIKRDGSVEDYDKQKIAKVVIAAGLTHEQAETLVQEVEKIIKQNMPDQISSLVIRDMVVAELTKINPAAVDLYKWYEITKDNKEK